MPEEDPTAGVPVVLTKLPGTKKPLPRSPSLGGTPGKAGASGRLGVLGGEAAAAAGAGPVAGAVRKTEPGGGGATAVQGKPPNPQQQGGQGRQGRQGQDLPSTREQWEAHKAQVRVRNPILVRARKTRAQMARDAKNAAAGGAAKRGSAGAGGWPAPLQG